jgi:hypothetical protein
MSDTDESLEELKGTDLEKNLKALKVDVESDMQSKYVKIAVSKIVKN